MEKEKGIIVVYNCDERYADAFAVSVLSLFECNKEAADLTVYLINNGIQPDSMRRIQEISAAYNRRIISIPMLDIEALVEMDVAIPVKSSRIASCGRLFVTSLLPENIEKVLYFDCDTIFLRSIKELWEIDLGEHYIGMMADVLNPNYRAMLGIPADGIYYNSGVAMINMKLWREKNVEKRFICYLQSQGGYVIPWPDQGILNAVLDGRILCLPCEYNVHSALLSFTYEELRKIKKPQWYYTMQKFEKAIKNPAIIHFTTTFLIPRRPWQKGCNHPYTNKFLEYRKMTPWRNEPLWEDERSISNRLLYSFYAYFAQHAPNWLYCFTSKLYYVDLQPLIFRIKKKNYIKKQRRLVRRGGVIKKSQGYSIVIHVDQFVDFNERGLAA